MPIRDITVLKAEAALPPNVTVVNVDDTIKQAAEAHGVNVMRFLAVAKCEDPGLIVDQQSNYVKNGKREESYGIFQINVKAHPEISIASATDPVFAANWAAQKWREGKEHQWSCYSIEQAKDWQ